MAKMKEKKLPTLDEFGEILNKSRKKVFDGEGFIFDYTNSQPYLQEPVIPIRPIYSPHHVGSIKLDSSNRRQIVQINVNYLPDGIYSEVTLRHSLDFRDYLKSKNLPYEESQSVEEIASRMGLDDEEIGLLGRLRE